MDIEARKSDQTPVVKIEPKLKAKLPPTQLQSYERDLRQRNSGETALLVLVPERRTAEAVKLASNALEKPGKGPWRVTDGYLPGIAVISWDELFDVLLSVEDERCRYEVEQLQSLYSELIGDVIVPFADDDSSCYSIGVRDPFEKWLTPIWMRFHKDTGNFKQISQRLHDWKPRVNSGGHIWIPLEVEPNISGDKMIEGLVKRTEEVLRKTYDLE